MSDAPINTLQQRLRPLGDGEGRTVVVLPSIDVDGGLLRRHAAELPALEERAQYLLLLLRRPGVRIVLVTSRPVSRTVLDAYLDFAPAGARERLTCVSPDDGSPRPLSEKLLAREDLLARIAALVPDPERAFIAPYSVGTPERDLALRLGIPLYGPPAHLSGFGTKIGGRRLFAQEGVPHPAGVEGVGDPDRLAEAIAELRARRPGLAAVVAKHNDSAYGEGNAVLALDALPEPGRADERDALRRLVATLSGDYLDALAADPGVVEEMIAGRDLLSPSVQMRIVAGGRPGLVSVHDQLLSGQTFVGCRFPADPEYGRIVAAEAAKARARLTREGAVGRFGVDFVVARDGSGAWRAWAIEINLREGGTSHPFGTLYLLTGARYDVDTGECRAPDGSERHYVASDDLTGPGWDRLEPEEVLAAAARSGLAFDEERGTGVVFHMLRGLRDAGVLGLTAIETTAGGAGELYARARGVVDDLVPTEVT